MTNWRTTYWNVFNAAGRLVGASFTVVGLIIGGYGVSQSDWLIAASGSIVAVLGVVLLVGKPYRPPGR